MRAVPPTSVGVALGTALLVFVLSFGYHSLLIVPALPAGYYIVLAASAFLSALYFGARAKAQPRLEALLGGVLYSAISASIGLFVLPYFLGAPLFAGCGTFPQLPCQLVFYPSPALFSSYGYAVTPASVVEALLDFAVYALSYFGLSWWFEAG